jgi:hypothetical protein
MLHVRRKFFDISTASGSPIATEAIDRSARSATWKPISAAVRPDERQRTRQAKAKPLLEERTIGRSAFQLARSYAEIGFIVVAMW